GIPRERGWGRQTPVWSRGDERYVGVEPPQGDGWERDPDVLDTWFSSGLWPFATLGWPEQTPQLRAFYPTDVNIHSVIQAPDGRRMSKSLGTGMDPLELIDVHGADALRFGLLAMSSAQDVKFNEERVKQGRDLGNKLWNASRLILQRVGEVEADAGAAETVEDRWIVSRLERLTASVSG